MKKKAHPGYQEADVHCGCGNQWKTRSTVAVIHTPVCSACHPYYTGKQKILDAAGMVERFQRKWTSDEAKKKAEDHAQIRSRKESPQERARRRAEAVLKGEVRLDDLSRKDKPKAATATAPTPPAASTPAPTAPPAAAPVAPPPAEPKPGTA